MGKRRECGGGSCTVKVCERETQGTAVAEVEEVAQDCRSLLFSAKKNT